MPDSSPRLMHLVCSFELCLLLADLRAGHHDFQDDAVLVAVNALRPAFRPAPTARSARPSGIDRACAQRRSSGTYVMAGYVYCGANGT